MNTLPLSYQCYKSVLTSRLNSPKAVAPSFCTLKKGNHDQVNLNATLKDFKITQVKFSDSYSAQGYRFMCQVARVMIWGVCAGLIAPVGDVYRWAQSYYYARKAASDPDEDKKVQFEKLSDHVSKMSNDDWKTACVFYIALGCLATNIATLLYFKATMNFFKTPRSSDGMTLFVMINVLSLIFVLPMYIAAYFYPGFFIPSIIFGDERVKNNEHLGLLSRLLRDELGIMQQNGDYLPFDPVVDQDEGSTERLEDVALDIVKELREPQTFYSLQSLSLSLPADKPQRPITTLLRFKIACADELLQLRSNLAAQRHISEEDASRYQSLESIREFLLPDLEKLPSSTELSKTIKELKNLNRLIAKIDAIFVACADARMDKHRDASSFSRGANDKFLAAEAQRNSLKNFNDLHFLLSVKSHLNEEVKLNPLQEELKKSGFTLTSQKWPSELFKTISLHILNDESPEELFGPDVKKKFITLALIHPDKNQSFSADEKLLCEKMFRYVHREYEKLKLGKK